MAFLEVRLHLDHSRQHTVILELERPPCHRRICRSLIDVSEINDLSAQIDENLD